MGDVVVSQLENGVHVLTETMSHPETVALGVWVNAGGRDEGIMENGIAHFLEHMAFKGTVRRSARAIVEEIEASGGEINAATAFETTIYYARVLKESWPLALDILADIFNNALLEPQDFEYERAVILQEIAAAQDQADDLVFELIQQASFGDHALSRSILGTNDLINSLTRQVVLNWRERHYLGARIVVSAVGAIDHERFKEQVTPLMAGIKKGTLPVRQVPVFAPKAALRSRDLDQTHIVLSFDAPGYHHEDIYGVQLLSNILGGGMSSRLFQELRERRGLCYNVFTYGSAYEDAGQLGVYAATASGQLTELIDLATEIMLSLMHNVQPAELARAKSQLKAGLVMNLESVAGRVDQISRQFLSFGEVPTIEKLKERLDAVSVADIGRLAQQLFKGQIPALSAVGQISDLPNYGDIVRKFK